MEKQKITQTETFSKKTDEKKPTNRSAFLWLRRITWQRKRQQPVRKRQQPVRKRQQPVRRLQQQEREPVRRLQQQEREPVLLPSYHMR